MTQAEREAWARGEASRLFCVVQDAFGKNRKRSNSEAIEAIADALLAAVAEEREACAKVAERELADEYGEAVAKAIRSRSTAPAGEEGK